ncbi:MAG: 4-hydroxy-tetrahydrodipicolinate reductase [Clostridia bacterium]|nr:4-hydroxy-tetrahydrodipicolinate reductase [Clostridia bacterium]
MINVILCGSGGKMGAFVADAVSKDADLQIVAGVDKFNNGQRFPVFDSFSSITADADVIIDFSNPALLDDLLKFACEKKIPAVLATTGYSEQQIAKIHSASKIIPIFFSFNMSLGVNLICSLAKKAASILGDGFDIEIIEKHHNQKLDAPSGTAIMLANAVNSEFDDTKIYEYDRHSKRQKRSKSEIGIHSVRGGTIVGEHDVIFAGHDEVITISHSAQSREVFAVGAVRAAKFLSGKAPGMYDMNSIMSFE